MFYAFISVHVKWNIILWISLIYCVREHVLFVYDLLYMKQLFADSCEDEPAMDFGKQNSQLKDSIEFFNL